jgi:hypothetical protein
MMHLTTGQCILQEKGKTVGTELGPAEELVFIPIDGWRLNSKRIRTKRRLVSQQSAFLTVGPQRWSL